MNRYVALQRSSSLRWDYTRNGMATGYCGGDIHREHHGGEYAAKFHDDGHATKEEAEACYHTYLLDNSLRFGELSGQQRQCAKCGAWTSGFAEVGMSQTKYLCDEHRTRETMEELTTPSEQVWSSY